MADATSKLNILVRVQDEASAALRRLSNDISDLGGSLNFAGMKAGILAGGMAAIAGGAILQSIKAFEEAEVQTAKFEAIMKTLSPELQKYRDRIIETADAAMKLGFNNDVAKVSIARLMQATGDAEFAFLAFQAAMDLARYKGISLEEATTALIMAFQGGGRLLKGFGIDIDEHASKETILAAVFQKVRGQAEAYAETLKGTRDILREYRGEVEEAIGQPFADWIKIIKDKLLDWIDRQGGINNLLEKFGWLIPYVGSVLIGVLGAGLAFVAAAALTALGPFGLILAGLAALAAAISVFVAVWISYWENIKKFMKKIVEAIKGIWEGLTTWFQENIIKWFEDKVKWVSEQIEKLKNWAKEAWEIISGTPSKIGRGVSEAIGAIKETKQLGGYISETGPYLLHRGEYVVPSRLVGAGIGGINIYLQGDFFTDAELARKFGDILAKEIKYQLKL